MPLHVNAPKAMTMPKRIHPQCGHEFRGSGRPIRKMGQPEPNAVRHDLNIQDVTPDVDVFLGFRGARFSHDGNSFGFQQLLSFSLQRGRLFRIDQQFTGDLIRLRGMTRFAPFGVEQSDARRHLVPQFCQNFIGSQSLCELYNEEFRL